jgi:hypothetical protein
MPLSASQAIDQVKQMITWREAEKGRLDRIRDYLAGDQDLYLPSGVPQDVRKIAKVARVNVLRYIVKAPTQALYVDGYRSAQSDTGPGWDAWQRNRMDARQMGVHRAALGYGVSYTIVLPGDSTSVIRGASPRKLTTVYGDDLDWPHYALEQRGVDDAKRQLWRLYDSEAAYWVGTDENGSLRWLENEEHGVGHTPVVRYLAEDNLDGDVTGIVEPLFDLQDQINLTTFALLVAQHYGAHRQRYIIGWLAESEEQALKAAAQKLWMFDDDPEKVKVGEFEQTQLEGYINSREASLRHLATISQTPVHELLGVLANLSAEALVAARDSHNRAVEEYRTMLGESHEQTLDLSARLDGQELDPGAWVRWRDMEARSLAATVDAFGKAVQMLGIPAQAFWDRVADVMGVSQLEVEEWKRLAGDGDPIAQMAALLERQASVG